MKCFLTFVHASVKFAFDSHVKEDAIPCVGAWKSKVQCSCPLENRIYPRKLKFCLDQTTYRGMRIGQIDTDVTARNEAILCNRHHRRDEGESSTHQQDQLILSDDSLSEVSSESDGISISGDYDEALNSEHPKINCKLQCLHTQ